MEVATPDREGIVQRWEQFPGQKAKRFRAANEAARAEGGEKLFSFLTSLMLRSSWGTVTMRFDAGK